MALRQYQTETYALQICWDADYQELLQTREFENPGGYSNVIAMSRMPGRPVTEYGNLSGVEKQMIKGKVTGIFE